MRYNDRLTMQELFQNRELAGILPQFTQREKLQNVYSIESIVTKIEQYIRRAFNGKYEEGKIIIKGNAKRRMQDMQNLKTILEAMYNNMPSIASNLRQNARVITPFMSSKQLKECRTTSEKLEATKIIFENILYNPNLQSRYKQKKQAEDRVYLQKQTAWMQKVGYTKLYRR